MLSFPNILPHGRHDADASQNIIGDEGQRRDDPVGHQGVGVHVLQLEDALCAEGDVGSRRKGHGSGDEHGDQGGEGIHHAGHAQQRHQKHRRHEHDAAQPCGHMEQLGQHSAYAGGHGHHHEEQEHRADGAGGPPQPFDVPRHQQAIHVGAAGHLCQPHKQDTNGGEQHRRRREAHIAPVAEAAEKLPQLLPGDEARAQKAPHIGKRQRPRFDLFHISDSLSKIRTVLVYALRRISSTPAGISFVESFGFR